MGIYTVSIQVIFLIMKLAGAADNVTWGFVLAPTFFHLGAATFSYLQQRAVIAALRKMVEQQDIDV